MSSSAAATAGWETLGSSASSSSEWMGRALAKSAASSSFASGVTADLHVGEWSGLLNAALSELGHLEQPEQRGQHLPRLRSRLHEVGPASADAEREERANHGDRTGHVDRSRHD